MSIMTIITYLLFTIFLFSDCFTLASLIKNRIQKNSVTDLNGIAGKMYKRAEVSKSAQLMFPVEKMTQDINLTVNAVFMIVNWIGATNLSRPSFLLYSFLTLILGGMYFHYYFVKDAGKTYTWFLDEEKWMTNVPDNRLSKTAERFYYQSILSGLFEILLIDAPLALFTIDNIYPSWL